MQESREPERMQFTHWATLFAVLLIALSVRLWGIASESIWFDECITYTFLDSPTLVEFYRGEAIHDPATVPLYYGSAYLWYNLGFTSIPAMRALSVIYGLAGITVIYFFGRRLFGHIGGLTAALCMSLAKIQIYMSQEIRNYALTLLLAAIAMYALREAIATGKRRWWVANVAATIMVCFTHFFGLLLPFAQGVYLLVTRPRRIQWTFVWAIVQLPFYALIPLWTWFVESGDVREETAWITWTPATRIFTTYLHVFPGSKQDAMDSIRRMPWGIPVHHVLAALFLIAGVGLVGYCAHAAWKKRDVRDGYQPAQVLLVFAWLFVPPVTLFLLSRLVQPCYIERYVLYSSLALYLVMGGAIAAIPKKSVQYAAIALLAIVYAGNLYDYNRPLRPAYNLTGAILRDSFAPGERLFANLDYIQKPMKYYAGIPNEANVGDGETFVEQAIAEARSGKRAWVWFIEVPEVCEYNTINAQINGAGLAVEHWEFAGRWPTHMYRLEPIGYTQET